MEYEVKIKHLSEEFLSRYPEDQYPEMMRKRGRPYTCLFIDTHSEYRICIPFRSSIEHNNAYIFKGTKRSRRFRSGLDYSKVVLINDVSYLDEGTATVDQDEYNATISNIEKIVADITKYIDGYVNHIKGFVKLHEREFGRKYKFSTLPYFHDILNLD